MTEKAPTALSSGNFKCLGSSGSEGESSWKDQIYIYLNHTDTPDILVDEFNGNVSNILAIRMT